jgi:hypothetical protein
MKKCTCHAGGCELHPKPDHYPPEQVGKRAPRSELEGAHESAGVPESRELLRREGGYALDKLVWLEGQSQRDDLDARRASAGATLALTALVLKTDLAAGRARSQGGKNSHKNVSRKVTPAKYAEACSRNPRSRKELARFIGVSLQAVRDWEEMTGAIPWRKRKGKAS